MVGAVKQPKDRGQFGDRLYALRRAAGLSQEELAKQIGISLSGYQLWETGKTPTPNIKNLNKAAEILGVDVSFLQPGQGMAESEVTQLRQEIREIRAMLEELSSR